MEQNAGNVVRDLRRKLGMTQEDFAREIAMTVWTVNRWENAHAEPSKLAWKAIQRLACARGLPEHLTDEREAAHLVWTRARNDVPVRWWTEARRGE